MINQRQQGDSNLLRQFYPLYWGLISILFLIDVFNILSARHDQIALASASCILWNLIPFSKLLTSASIFDFVSQQCISADVHASVASIVFFVMKIDLSLIAIIVPWLAFGLAPGGLKSLKYNFMKNIHKQGSGRPSFLTVITGSMILLSLPAFGMSWCIYLQSPSTFDTSLFHKVFEDSVAFSVFFCGWLVSMGIVGNVLYAFEDTNETP